MSQKTTLNRAAAFAKGFASDPLTHWPFPVIARRFYGNLSGFRQNLYGSVHANYHRVVGSPAKGFALDPEARALTNQLRRTGMAMANGWIDPPVLERVRQRVLQTAEDEGNRRSEYMTVLEGRHLAQSTPEIFDLFDAKIRAFLEAYFGGAFLVNSTAFRLTRHVPDAVLQRGEVFSDHWHTDSGPTSMLAMFVLLNDVTPDGGPTSALDIPATKSVVRRGYTSRKVDGELLSEIETHPSKTQMVGPAGTVLFVNVARCLHRAGIPAENLHREWLQFRLFPCHQPTDTSQLKPAKILTYTNRIAQDF